MEAVRGAMNRVSMYQGLIGGLLFLWAMAVLYAFTGVISLSVTGIIVSLISAVAGGFVANQLFSQLFKVASHTQAWLVTALILTFILPPATSFERAGLIALTAAIAMASKYLLVWRGAILFNPVAIAAVIVGISGLLPVTWWVANPSLLPYMIIVGFITLFNHRLFSLFAAFALPSLLLLIVSGVNAHDALASWPLLFLGTIMLTEPTTLPAKHKYRLLYGALVGCLFASQLHFGPVRMTPELALVIGNIFAFMLVPRLSRTLRLKRHEILTSNVHELVFEKPVGFNYKAGQYADWTVPAQLTDSRGNRRRFSFASGPSEPELRFTYRSPTQPSAFKTYLNALQPGAIVRASTVRGNFTLPSDTKPLLLIAGGIGITPFRSMAAEIVDAAEPRDVILLYGVREADDAVYGDIFKQASKYGWQTRLITGPINNEALIKVGDIKDRHVMISGSPAMVAATKKLLTGQGVSNRRIQTDEFAGY